MIRCGEKIKIKSSLLVGVLAMSELQGRLRAGSEQAQSRRNSLIPPFSTIVRAVGK